MKNNKKLLRILKIYFGKYFDGKKITTDHDFVGGVFSVNPTAYRYQCTKCNKVLYFNTYQIDYDYCRVYRDNYPLSCKEEMIKSIIE